MRRLSVIVLMVLLAICYQKGESQYVIEDLSLASHFLYGEQLSAFHYAPDKRWMLAYSEKKLVISTPSPLATVYEYEAPPETKINFAIFKQDDPSLILIHLSNGTVDGLAYDKIKGWREVKTIASTGFSSVKKIIGDAVYILNQGKIYASWDTAKTWKIDSINISKFTVSDISVDTNFYGWISTSQGVFFQHPDSTIWRKAVPLPGSFQNATAIFADRRNRIFVSRPGEVYYSSNRGSSWNDISDGSMESIVSFGDDAFGNIYAVGQGSRAYRLSNLTLPWISIGDSIKAQAYLPSSEKIINSISGDSILFAATRYGMFQSTDFGVNWIVSPKSLQTRSHNFYTGAVKGGKYYFLSTNLGLYRVAVGDSIWEKVFPKQGFVYGINALTSDSAGNVYGNLPIKTGPSSWLFYTVKSTDYGTTWIPDTAGFKSLGITAGTQTYDFWVDRQGTQYLGGNARFLTKKPGQAWKLDTAGLGMQANQYIKTVTLNNKKRIIYVSRTVFSGSLKLFIYSKTINDSAWKIVNTSILAAGDGILSSDQDGNIMIKAFSSPEKIWRYDGSTWTEVLLPTTIGSSPTAYPLTIDKNGVVWAVFFAGGSNKGVYFTTNNGSTWKYVGLNGVGIKFLTAAEDSISPFMKQSGAASSAIYAVTIIDGIHRFTTASEPTPIEIDKPQSVKTFELYQNYPNPFNPSTTIRFAIPVSGFVSITVFDILGREVATLLNEESKEGVYSVPFNGSKLSSGVYFYRMQAGEFMNTKKLLLQK